MTRRAGACRRARRMARAGAMLTAPLFVEQREGAALELLAIVRAEIEQDGGNPPGIHSRGHLTLQSSVAGRSPRLGPGDEMSTRRPSVRHMRRISPRSSIPSHWGFPYSRSREGALGPGGFGRGRLRRRAPAPAAHYPRATQGAPRSAQRSRGTPHASRWTRPQHRAACLAHRRCEVCACRLVDRTRATLRLRGRSPSLRPP